MSGVPCRSSAASAGATAGDDDGLACDAGETLVTCWRGTNKMITAAAIRATAARTPSRARVRPGDGTRRVTSPSRRDGEEVLADPPVRLPAGGMPGHTSTVRPAAHSSASRGSRRLAGQCLVHKLAQLRADRVRAGGKKLGKERDGQLFGWVDPEGGAGCAAPR